MATSMLKSAVIYHLDGCTKFMYKMKLLYVQSVVLFAALLIKQLVFLDACARWMYKRAALFSAVPCCVLLYPACLPACLPLDTYGNSTCML